MRSVKPPYLATRFLRLYCRQEFYEEIQGDILELFELRVSRKGLTQARLKYTWDVLRFFRWSNIKRTQKLNSNFIAMTRNNFKVAARMLWRQKVNTLMNVAGISIGIACFMLIALYARQELTFDAFHEKKDDIYRAWVKEVYADGRVFFNTNTPLPLGTTLKDNVPAIEEFVMRGTRQTLVGRGQARIADVFDIGTPNFFEVFDFPILSGNATSPLGNKTDIVLTQSYAQKYFGQEEAVGQTLPLQIGSEVRDFVVSAVAKDSPLNTGLQWNMMISYENKDILYNPRQLTSGWFNISPETYILLRPGTDPESLQPQIREMVKGILGGTNAFDGATVEDHYLIGFQPLTDIHLNNEIPAAIAPVGNPDYVYILSAIGLLVMVIACVNYTTLSIGQSFRRSKEVGVRKAIGARSGGLIWQYLSESILIALLSMAFGILFTFLLLPIFNDLAQTNLQMPWNLEGLLFALSLTAIIGLLSGAYPALVLSRFKAINVLRSAGFGGMGKQWARRSMVVFQFLLTVFLISSTLIMRKQLNYMQEKDLGYSYNAMVSVPLYAKEGSRRLSQQVSTAMENGESLIGELERNPQLADFAMGSHVFGTPGWVTLGFNANTGNYLSFNFLVVDANYLKAFDIEMKEGVDFDENLEIHKTQGVILNAKAAEYFGMENPIGAKLPGDNFGEHRVIGVTEDFNFESLHNDIQPLVIVQNPIPIFEGINDFNSGDSVVPKLVFRYQGASLTAVNDVLEPAWAKIFPDEELNFNFVEERLQNQYQDEARVNKIVTIATVLSIAIASLGLLGLTLLVVNNKVKEIGIRKVLGASPGLIFQLLFKGFSIQLLVAVILSVPATWYLMDGWLDDFAYRTNMGVDMFLLSAALALIIMLLVVSYHVMKAAKANPVNALRTE